MRVDRKVEGIEYLSRMMVEGWYVKERMCLKLKCGIKDSGDITHPPSEEKVGRGTRTDG